MLKNATILKNNYIVKVHDGDRMNTKWLLPHFPVVNQLKETTKVRIVFDGSASYKNCSLNDAIHQGPNLQQDLLKVLMRFRINMIAIVCDIEEMFLQVEMKPEDRTYFRFLWRDNPRESPEIYEFQRVIFGGRASPFLAQFVARFNASRFQNEFPRAVETIEKSTYMDDSLYSVGLEEEAVELCNHLTHVWGEAGMVARKWLSNSAEVMEVIPLDKRAGNVEIKDSSSLPTSKTLGIVWDANTDMLRLKINIPKSVCGTKREFLRVVSSVFDPLGLVSPMLILAKVMMQELWIKKVEWDEKLERKG